MKKISITLLGLLACGAAHALPMGNPADPSLLTDGIYSFCDAYDDCNPCSSWLSGVSLRVGYQGDFVFNRKLKLHNGTTLTRARIMTNAGLIFLNFCDRLDVYGQLGATNIDLEGDGNAFSFSSGTSRLEVATETDFSWAVGAKAVLVEWCDFVLGADGRYFATSPHLRREVLSGFETFHDSATLDYTEWQVALGLSYRVDDMFVPYVAVAWAVPRVKRAGILPSFEGDYVNGPYKEQHYFGYLLGLTIVDCDKLSITGEVRLIDETAASVNAQVRF